MKNIQELEANLIATKNAILAMNNSNGTNFTANLSSLNLNSTIPKPNNQSELLANINKMINKQKRTFKNISSSILNKIKQVEKNYFTGKHESVDTGSTAADPKTSHPKRGAVVQSTSENGEAAKPKATATKPDKHSAKENSLSWLAAGLGLGVGFLAFFGLTRFQQVETVVEYS